MIAFWISSGAAAVLFVSSLVSLLADFTSRAFEQFQDILLVIVLIEFVIGCAAVMW